MVERWKRVITLSDAGGEEALEIHTCDGSAEVRRLDELDIGHVRQLSVCPKGDDLKDQLLIVNQRFELLHIELETPEMQVLDKSEYGRIGDATWSPDGKWIVYSFPCHRNDIIHQTL